MGVFKRHEACPRCGSRDNLARYEDGSAWCFGCGHKERADGSTWVPPALIPVKEEESVTVSDDLCNDFPRHVVEWLARYDVSVEEAISHGWKYSPKWDQLTFLFYGQEGELAVSQARNFREGAKRKYYNQGSPAQVLPIFGLEKPHSACLSGTRRLVVVEDVISAVRVARAAKALEGPWCHAMPCLGSYLPAKKLTALKLLNYEQLIVWLDSDKLKEAREIATTAKWLGFSTKVVYTELDPKEYSDKEISEYLQLT